MRLYKNGATPTCETALRRVMAIDLFAQYRLDGDTALSLQLGHRRSGDISLSGREKLDPKVVATQLTETFNYCEEAKYDDRGVIFFIGDSEMESVKLEIKTSTDGEYSSLTTTIDGIRLTTIEEIAATKIESVIAGGKKSDFWDLHRLLKQFTIGDLLELHEERYPANHDSNQVLKSLTNFSEADGGFDPICLTGDSWEEVKLDIYEAAEEHTISSILAKLSDISLDF